MLGFAIILVEFVLSGRFRTVSARIGIDVTMRFHQLLARTALAFALVHPFLYRSPFRPAYPWDVTRRTTVNVDALALASGTLGWIMLVVLVALSIGRDKIPYKYETWRMMHGIGAVLIAALILHHTLTMGRYSQDPWLAALWATLFAIAVLTLAFVYLAKPVWQMLHPWAVHSIKPIAHGIWELTLDPIGHSGLDYEAGQFAWVNVGNSSFSLRENPFSISSAPTDGKQLRFIIKELGDFTSTIGQILPGTKAYVDGPHGNLMAGEIHAPGIALIAGGVGIAPLLSILRELKGRNDRRPTVLVYGNRIKEQIVHRNELREIAAKDHGTTIVHVLSHPPDGWQGRTGMIDQPLIQDLFRLPEMRQWLFVLCGPPEMMNVVEDTLIGLGVGPNRIVSERFKYD